METPPPTEAIQTWRGQTGALADALDPGPRGETFMVTYKVEPF